MQEPEILCVGEAPGRQEAHDLKPFVGPSGQLIRKMLLSAGFDPVKQAWANAVMCFPQAQPDPSKSDNPAYVEPTRGTFETPDKKDAQVCTQQNLLPLIDRLRPKSILCLGAVATSIFFDSRLKDVSGQAKTWNGIPVISTYHPSYVLRSPEKESVLRKDIQKLRVMLYPQGLRRKFFVVRDREMLERARRWLEEKMRPGTLRVGTDIETNTLDPLDPHALIKCVGFGDDKQAYTIFINQKDPVYNEQAVEYVRWLLARPDIVHSFCRSWFDVKFLLSKGITVNRFEDIQAKAFLLNENRYEYGLKELSLEYIGEYTNTMNDKDEEELGRYCGEDASNTYILDGIFDAKLRPGLRQVHDKVMMPMVPVINEMMLTGIKINKEYAKSLEKVVEKESADLREKLSKDYPVFNGINIHSPDQLQRIVYRVLNMKPTIKTKTGYSVGEPVLSHFAEEGQRWAQLILDIRGKDKLLSTYVKAIPRQVSFDGRIRTEYNLIGARTGRLASKAPNLQNIVRDDKIYRMFIADRNKQFFYFDFSQLELRVGCSVAEEEKMIAAFKEGRDLHMQTACMVYNKEQKDIAPEERQVAKSINFGLLYGMSERGLKEYLFLKAGVDVSAEEAQVMHQRFFQLYTGLTAWYRRVEQELMSKCRIVYKTGRIRRFPQMRGARQIPPDVFNQAVNCGVQGAASDLVLFSTASFFRLVKKRKLPAKFVLTVHDSVILEIEKDEGLVEELTELINMVIKDKVPQDPMFSWVRVPLEVDVKVGPTWGDLQKAKK